MIPACGLTLPQRKSNKGKDMKNDYYVYVHKIKSTSEIFYVGKGRGKRAYNKSTIRNSKWETITKSNEWEVEILQHGMTSDEAFDLEFEIINKIHPKANLHKFCGKPKPIDWELFSKFFYYDPEARAGLRVLSKFGKLTVGSEVGYTSCRGYFSFIFKGHQYLAHRVIWAILNKEDPGAYVIDHIDRNRQNNNITNLRKITQRENSKNVSIREGSYTGIIGVQRNKEGYRSAITLLDGTHQYKKFPIKKFGEDLALALAKEYRYRFANIENGYLPDVSYKRDVCLDKYTEEEINKMLTCDKYSNNTSGKTGILFLIEGGKTVVVARHHVNGKRISKKFFVSKVGLLPAFKLAVEWKQAQEDKYKNNRN